MFESATEQIQLEGTEVVPFALFKVLDGQQDHVARCLMILVVGKTPSDYLQRVEPSPSGGAKMAQALMGAALGQEEEFF